MVDRSLVSQLHARLGISGFSMIVGPIPWVPSCTPGRDAIRGRPSFGYHDVFHLMTLIRAGLHLDTVAFVVIPKM